MIKTAPVMDLRKNLGEILNEVEYKHDTIVVTRGGKASAAIIDIKLFEKIRSMKDRFERLSHNLRDSFSDLSEQEKLNLVDEALESIRRR